MNRADDLRRDYDLLGGLMETAKGREAAQIARERRLIGELLERLEADGQVSFVDELAAKRADAGRPPARRKFG